MKYLSALVVVVLAGSASAQSIAVSVGVRETGSVAPLGADGGTSGGIEWVNRDLNIVPLDGAWHQVTVDFPNGVLTPFAGLNANGMWDTVRGTFEQIRIRNTQGITDPMRIFIDDVRITYLANSFLFDWEAQAPGSEHVFRPPAHSGSTFANLLPGSSGGTSAAAAHAGIHSFEANFAFVDDDPNRWVRLYTFDSASGPNPTVDFRGSMSFWIMGQTVPAPSGAALLGMAMAALARRRRR